MPTDAENRDLIVERGYLTGEMTVVDAPPDIDIPHFVPPDAASRMSLDGDVVTFAFTGRTLRYRVVERTDESTRAVRIDDGATVIE